MDSVKYLTTENTEEHREITFLTLCALRGEKKLTTEDTENHGEKKEQ